MPRKVLSVIVLASLLALACSGTALAAPTWLEPKNLSEKGFGAFSPRVGFDGSGQAVTSWFGATDTTGDTTQISERPRAGEWSAVKNLQVDGTNTPDLAVSANGTAVVAWEFDDVPESPDGSYIEASVRTNGVWSSAAPLPKDKKTHCSSPITRAWPSTRRATRSSLQEGYSPADKTLCFHNEGEYVVRASVRMAGGEWSTPKDVTTGTTENAKKLSAAINPSGDIAVAWEDMKGNRAYVSLKRAGQEPVDHTLSTKTSGSPQVAFAADGTAIAVWDENDAGLWVSGSTAAPGGGTWSAPQHLSSNGYDAFQPDLAVAPGGEAVAVWETLAAIDENSPVAVQGAIRSGGTWLPAQSLSAEVPFKKLRACPGSRSTQPARQPSPGSCQPARATSSKATSARRAVAGPARNSSRRRVPGRSNRRWRLIPRAMASSPGARSKLTKSTSAFRPSASMPWGRGSTTLRSPPLGPRPVARVQRRALRRLGRDRRYQSGTLVTAASARVRASPMPTASPAPTKSRWAASTPSAT